MSNPEKSLYPFMCHKFKNVFLPMQIILKFFINLSKNDVVYCGFYD